MLSPAAEPLPAASLPTEERLAFVFTDIEGSTRLLERLQGAYGEVLATHAELVREAIAAHGGREVDTQGDAFFVVFPDPAEAVRFAADIQRDFAGHPWTDGVTVRLRIGIHVGQAAHTRTGYVGMDVHHGARVAGAAHGGQVLVSGAVAGALAEATAGTPALRSLGAFTLKDIREPVELLQVEVPGLPSEFPPPRSLDELEEPPTAGDPPYPGLAQYEEGDAERFFGREVLVASLVERLDRQPFLAIVGASGSGKSSLVRAGLIPALRRGGRGDERRPIALLTPTDEPPAALDRALTDLAGPPWAIVVDQLEELFTLCRDDDQRRPFVDRLMGTLDSGARVVVALRADFYDRLAGLDRLRTLAAEHQAYLGPLGPDDLRAAIEGPARQGGWRLAPGLVDLIMHDVGHEPGALPLLSHALAETWARRRGTQLSLRGYLDSGGVQGAIARTADQLVAGLQGAELTVARDIFLRLTELGEETPDTRRRATLVELLGGDRERSATRLVLDRLVAARLVVADDRTAEVAHEALIREWPQLREWLDQDRDALRLHRIVTDAAAEWDRSGRDASLLFRGARLAQAAEWLASHRGDANELERRFIAASRDAAEQEAAEREAGRQRELEAARRLADEQTRANRRLRRRALGLVAALIAAGGLAVAAVVFGQQAQESTTLAQARELAASAEAASDRDPELGVLLAIEAVERRPNPETDRQLRRALAGSLVRARFEGHRGPVTSVAVAQVGTRMASAGEDGTVRVWDTGTHAQTLLLRPGEGMPTAVALSPDGSRVAAVSDHGWVWLWDAEGGDLLGSWRAHERSVFPRDARQVEPRTDMAFDPTGERLATAGEDGTVGVWDTETGQELVRFPPHIDPPFRGVAWSPDGARILTAGPGALARVWDAATGQLSAELVGHVAKVVDVAFEGDGGRVVTGGTDNLVRVWDATTGTEVALLEGHGDFISSVAFAPAGEVVTGSWDGTAAIWDAASGKRITTLTGHAGRVTDVAVSPDGAEIFTAGNDGTVRAWARWNSPPVQTLGAYAGYVGDATYDPTGSRVVVALSDYSTVILDAVTGEDLHTLEGHTAQVQTASFSPDGSRVVTASLDGTARVWDATTGEAIVTLEGHGDWVRTAAWDATGRLVVTAGNDGTARVWDATTGVERGRVSTPSTPISAIFAADPERIVIGERTGDIGVWDWATGQLHQVLSGHSGPVDSVAFSPDGARLVSASRDGSARVWHMGTGRSELELSGGHGRLYRARFSPDGSRIATGGSDGAAHVWDARSGSPLADIAGDPEGVFSAAFAPDGRHLLLAHQGSATVHLCDLCGPPDEVMELARSRVTRELRPEEREAFLHESVDVAPAPSGSLAPPPIEAPPEASAPPLAADDICLLDPYADPCEFAPGTYRPSVFRPRISFSVGEMVQTQGQYPGTIAIDLGSGEILMTDGAATWGRERQRAVRIGTNMEDLLAYLRSRPWLKVGEPRVMQVDGRAAVALDIESSADGEEVLLQGEVYDYTLTPGSPSTRFVAAALDGTYLLVVGRPADEESADTFFTAFDAFVMTIALAPPP